MLFDFKLYLKVVYPNGELVHRQYSEISMAFTDFFDCYVQPSRTLKLRKTEQLPTVRLGNTEFRAIGCNPFIFRNFLGVVKNNQVWIPMRLHELIYLQLQFYPQKLYQVKPLNPRTGLPENAEFAQGNHSNQNELDELLRNLKLKFWLPLQNIRHEVSISSSG